MVKVANDPQDKEQLKLDRIEEEFASTDERIARIEKIIKDYQTEGKLAMDRNNPEKLSEVLIALARANSALGTNAAFAKYIARNADRAYRRLREQKKLDYIEKGMAIGKAESAAYTDKEVAQVFEIYSEAQLLADRGDDLAYRTDTFLKMSQSALSLIKKDLHGR